MENEPAGNGKIKANANDFLANERTFLAWVRTSLAIMAFGFVVVKFSLFLTQLHIVMGIENYAEKQMTDADHNFSSLIGYIMILLGMAVLFVSYFRYSAIYKNLLSGIFNPTGRIMTYLTIGIVLVLVLLLIYLL